MKKNTILLFVSIFIFGTTFTQNSPQLFEKGATDLGKILDFKASISMSKSLSTNLSESKLLLESKSFSSSETRFIEFTKSQVSELIAVMNSLNTTYLSTLRKSNIEIVSSVINTFELGCVFEVVVEKAPAVVAATKKEKYYIETKEKYYEGKIVNSDQSGTYIWKEVASTVPVKEVTGKWTPYYKISNSTSRSTTNITIEEFKTLLKFLEENVSKL